MHLSSRVYFKDAPLRTANYLDYYNKGPRRKLRHRPEINQCENKRHELFIYAAHVLHYNMDYKINQQQKLEIKLPKMVKQLSLKLTFLKKLACSLVFLTAYIVKIVNQFIHVVTPSHTIHKLS